MEVSVIAVSSIGPGFNNWSELRAILRGEQSWQQVPTTVPAAQGLPSAERRRVGVAVRIALASAHQVFESAGITPENVQSVFATSSGDGQNCHILCEALAQPQVLVSPTRFTNSVHNAAAGYWGIATGSMAASTSLCGFDGSFAAGLFEASTLVLTENSPVVLVAFDAPYPQPLQDKRPILDAMGVALVLAPVNASGNATRDGIVNASDGSPSTVGEIANLKIEMLADGATAQTTSSADNCTATGCREPESVPVDLADSADSVHTIHNQIPAARCLGLLAAIAADAPGSVVTDGGVGQQLQIQINPARTAIE